MATASTPVLTPSFLDSHAGTWPGEVHRMSEVERMVWLAREASALDAVDYGRSCVRHAQSGSERRRRALVQRRRELITDNWQHLLYADMKQRIREPGLWPYVMGDNGRFCDISRNPFKNILQETAVLYKAAAARETPEAPEDAELYRKLVRGTKFNVFWAAVEFELMVFNDLIIWPSIVTIRGERTLRHNKAAGDTVTAIYDAELGGRAEPYALVFIDHWYDGSRERERYFWWTPQWRAIYDDDADLTRLDNETLLPLDDEEQVPIDNPYGQMIFEYLHVDPYHPTFWNQTAGDDLIELTLKTGRQQTQTTDLFNRSSHKQLVTTGSEIREREDKTLADPGAHIKIRSNGSTQIVDWGTDFEARQRLIDNDEARAAGTYGINPERLRKTSYQTAEGARLTERPLEERRAKMREPLSDAERGYRESVIRVCDRERYGDDLPDPEVWMEVIHAPIAYPGDPQKQVDVDAAEISLGIISPVEVIQRRYPGISRDEAFRRLRANLEDQAEVARIKQSVNAADNPMNRSADDEDNGRLGPQARDGNIDGQLEPGTLTGSTTERNEDTDDNA